MRPAALFVCALATCADAAITGLQSPTSMTVHAPSGRVFFSQKSGSIVAAASLAAATTVSAFNVTGVASSGDLGLTSVLASAWRAPAPRSARTIPRTARTNALTDLLSTSSYHLSLSS
jgi:hypothetical protein